MKLSPTALCLSRTWPGPGLSTPICCQISTSGPPVFSKRIACTIACSSQTCWEVLERAFQREQGLLGLQPALSAIATEAGLRQHTVARDDNRDRILAASAADGARSRSDFGRQVAITSGLAIRNFLHRRPNLVLEIRSGGTQRQVETGQRTGEIGFELARGLGEQGAAVEPAFIAPADRDDRSILFVDDKVSHGAQYR